MLSAPKDEKDFIQKFGENEQCLHFLKKIKEKDDKFTCSVCGCKKLWHVRESTFECAECNHQESVLSGTIFKKSHKSLKQWFLAIWSITKLPIMDNQVNGLKLQQLLGLKTYKTAWTWLLKIRQIMIHPERDRLSGTVEIEKSEIKVPRPKNSKKQNKLLIAIAMEIVRDEVKKIRIGILADSSQDSQYAFLRQSVKNETPVINVYGEKKHFNSTISSIKKWIKKIPSGCYSQKYLQYYFDEYTFRYNHRNETDRGKLFSLLIKNAICKD